MLQKTFNFSETVFGADHGAPRTAHFVVHECDQGHYGSTTCSNCGEKVETEFRSCKKCGATFVPEIKATRNVGGSDF